MRLLKDEEIKFSTDRFLVNKWLFAKTNEHFRTRFVRHYEDYILQGFRSFAFKSQ